jgi:hypothetical protein
MTDWRKYNKELKIYNAQQKCRLKKNSVLHSGQTHSEAHLGSFSMGTEDKARGT